ncbi:MAG: glpX [Paenibacillaceae bacterium]|nr:glpX [Paenibacillaceae bacterium]
MKDWSPIPNCYDPMKLLGLELVEVCEAAAVASARWIGRGKKNEADDAATSAMRQLLNRLPMKGTVVIGEGELDEAPMLYIGEALGTGNGPAVDIAVDPLEGTSLVADGRENAISVIAMAPRGCLLHAPDMYMEKLAVGPDARGCIDLNRSIVDNARAVAAALCKPIEEVTVAIQKRERHDAAVEALREAGVKVMTFQEGDVSAAVATAVPGSDVDMFYGIGGAPEGVVSAVALRCLGGDMQARLMPQDRVEADRCRRMGIEDHRVILALEDLVRSDDCLFAATGITESPMLQGTRRQGDKWLTHSMLALGRKKQMYFLKNLLAQEIEADTLGTDKTPVPVCI